jgi:hypothetical protein
VQLPGESPEIETPPKQSLRTRRGVLGRAIQFKEIEEICSKSAESELLKLTNEKSPRQLPDHQSQAQSEGFLFLIVWIWTHFVWKDGSGQHPPGHFPVG